MLSGFFAAIAKTVSQFVHRPLRVLAACMAVVFVGLVFDGTLFRLWSLHRDSLEIQEKTTKTVQASKDLKMKIVKASDTEFIGLQAQERFDLVGQGDLVFIFADEE